MIHFYLQMCIAHEEIEELMLIDDAFCKDEAAEIKSVERDVFFKASNATEKELIKDEPFCKAKTSTTSIAMAVATTGNSLQLHHGVVSFRGVNLIQEDINSFHGTNWLTDNAIGFILATISSNYPHDKLVVVPPSESVLLSNPDSSAKQVHILGLDACSIAVIPVNSEQFNPSGGSGRWSLLVLDNTC